MRNTAGQVPGDRRYTREHLWVLPDGDGLLAGITDFAQAQLGEVIYVGLPDPGQRFQAGEGFGTVESMKSASELCMPVSGEITAVNPALEDSPGQVNAAPYGQGWLVRIRPNDPAEAGRLLAAEHYAALAVTD